jgi:hypothetical protein
MAAHRRLDRPRDDRCAGGLFSDASDGRWPKGDRLAALRPVAIIAKVLQRLGGLGILDIGHAEATQIFRKCTQLYIR